MGQRMINRSRSPLNSLSHGAPANPRSKTCGNRRSHPSAQRAEKEVFWVVWSLASLPRLVHQPMATKAGGRCIPESQCRPGTNTGGPPGIEEPRIEAGRFDGAHRTQPFQGNALGLLQDALVPDGQGGFPSALNKLIWTFSNRLWNNRRKGKLHEFRLAFHSEPAAVGTGATMRGFAPLPTNGCRGHSCAR